MLWLCQHVYRTRTRFFEVIWTNWYSLSSASQGLCCFEPWQLGSEYRSELSSVTSQLARRKRAGLRTRAGLWVHDLATDLAFTRQTNVRTALKLPPLTQRAWAILLCRSMLREAGSCACACHEGVLEGWKNLDGGQWSPSRSGRCTPAATSPVLIE